MRTLNLGILAHIDAGKTSLTERLLYDAGVIAEIGSVDAGSTQTDSLELERRRGITIKSAVASFTIGDLAVNLIDTPGHPDFIAEVERVLSVLDGAVLVVSAVEGVQAQTRILMRALRRLRIPTLIFVNKADRRGADPDRVLRDLTTKLTLATVPMTSATQAGTRETAVRDAGNDPTTVLAEGNDTVLAAYVDGTRLGRDVLHDELAKQTRDALVHPVYVGSAITGAGVPELTSGLRELLPAAEDKPDNPVSATVFKVERGPAGEKIAYARMFDGTIATRDRVTFGACKEAKVTAISVFDRGPATRRTEITAGQIGKLWGLTDIRIGDVIGDPRPGAREHHFAPPTLETVVVPAHPGDKGWLRTALGQLAEQDPLIDVRQDDVRQEISVSLYGEVQKEVVQATLAEEFGVEVTFRETTTICVERPAGTGAAYELIGTDPNPFLATVGLRVEPAPIGSGVEFRLGVELGSMPFAFFRAVEETVRTTLQQGINGWEVTDCVVTMTHSGYYARQSHSHGTFDKSMSSTAGDFRNLTPLVLMDALLRAGTLVCEPLQRFRLELPSDLFGTVLPVLTKLRAVPHTPEIRGAVSVMEGEIPSALVHDLEQQLPGITRGEGMLETEFSRHQPVRGTPPSRSRTDDNPLDRKEYLLHVERRV